MLLIVAVIVAVGYLVGSRVLNVNATVTIPQDEIRVTTGPGGTTVKAGTAQGGPQIPTEGNTLPGSPEYGPDVDPSQPSYWLNHEMIPGEGSTADG